MAKQMERIGRNFHFFYKFKNNCVLCNNRITELIFQWRVMKRTNTNVAHHCAKCNHLFNNNCESYLLCMEPQASINNELKGV